MKKGWPHIFFSDETKLRKRYDDGIKKTKIWNPFHSYFKCNIVYN